MHDFENSALLSHTISIVLRFSLLKVLKRSKVTAVLLANSLNFSALFSSSTNELRVFKKYLEGGSNNASQYSHNSDAVIPSSGNYITDDRDTYPI